MTYPGPLEPAPVMTKEQWIAYLAANAQHPAIEQMRMDAFVHYGVK